MSGRWTPQFVPAPCRRCTGYGEAHCLTCPTMQLRVRRRIPGRPLTIEVSGGVITGELSAGR